LPNLPGIRNNQNIVPPGRRAEDPISDLEYNKKRAATQEEIDYILDKISKSGYSSLSSKGKGTPF